MTRREWLLSHVVIGACLLGSNANAIGQEPTSDAVQKEAVAEAILAREEAATERAFDGSFRAKAKELLAGLPLAELLGQTGDDGLGLNSLGDTQADLVYTPVTPCRIVDTRLAGGILGVGVPRNFLVTGTNYGVQGGSATGCGVPFGPTTAAVINFVAVSPTGKGNMQITPFGQPMPTASFINYSNTAGTSLANGLAVALCNPSAATCTSDITIRANVSSVHLVGDVEGYFQRVATGGVGTALLADAAVTAPKISAGTVVRSLNSQTDAVTLAGSNGLGVTQGSGTVTVSSNATAANTPSTIVARDASGSFSAGTVTLAGDMALPNTASPSVGVVTVGGTRFLHNFGTANTFVGANAGNLTLTGQYNSAFGAAALHATTTGGGNSAFGTSALASTTAGGNNAAFGFNALVSNTAGSNNSAFGPGALELNGIGNFNSAFGFLALANATTASDNSAFGATALQANTEGGANTAVGRAALQSNVTGNDNTAVGYGALQTNTASNNSAFGYLALAANTTGTYNSAFGNVSLTSNTTGASNTAFGNWTLSYNVQGNHNTAVGDGALNHNTASDNTAVGYQALLANTTGTYNTAVGFEALQNSVATADNTGVGYHALQANVTGNWNAAFGSNALAATAGIGSSAFGYEALRSATDSYNSAFGYRALVSLSSGSDNVALGYWAGYDLTSGSNNIYIGNAGGESESDTIRIGSGATATYISGISGVNIPVGTYVYINPVSHQLGTQLSSRRYKEQIVGMDAESDVLLKLRPVSFYYRPDLDGTHTRQYGLVAEEVAEVAPGLVAYGKDGQPQTVLYQFVNAMLLSEVQKQRRLIESQDRQLQALEAEVRELGASRELVEELTRQLSRLEARLPQ